jgi:hypothetical protein
VRTDHLVLEALEEQLPTAARAEGLVGVVPHRCLAAAGGVSAAQLLEGRTAGAGRYEDLPEAMSTEIAVKLGTNGHRKTSTGTTPKNGARVFLCSSTRKRPFSFR